MSFETKIVFVWILLIVATLLSWLLGSEHGLATTAAIIIVAGIKVRLIGLWFMELRNAILPLRMVFEIYVVIVCTMMLWFFISAPG